MKLPHHIITQAHKQDEGDEFADKRGVGNTVEKSWWFQTLQSERPCNLCGKIGSYTKDTNTPSYDMSFCLNEFANYRVSKKNKKCTCGYIGHRNSCYFKKFQNYRNQPKREESK